MDPAVRNSMKIHKVTVIDYGMGNIWSVVSALKYLNCDAVVSSDPSEIEKAETLLLPGVGSFRKAMQTLHETGLDSAIINSVRGKKAKILGICLGMQLLGSQSTEDGITLGLNLIPSSTKEFSMTNRDKLKSPHIGFDQVSATQNSKLFHQLPQDADFYFVHSYRMLPDGLQGVVAKCTYGEDFLAAYEIDNIFATQFHPEKSQTNGLKLIKNFLQADCHA
jgi:glutamine amidotransferase